MNMISVEQLQKVLTDRFGGSLSQGQHPKEDQASGLELLSVAQGIPFTDSPQNTRTFDLHPINDMDVTPEERTTGLLPVLAAYAGSMDWPVARQEQVVKRIIILTVQRIIAELPGLPEELRTRCRTVKTIAEAARAAGAAEAVEAARAAGSARAVRAAETARAAWVAWAPEADGAAGAARVDRAVRAALAARAAGAAGAAGAAARAAEAAWVAEEAWAEGAAVAAAAAWAAGAARAARIRVEVFRTACALWLEAVR